jgi:exopolyphosphatase/guanosine-5'-triphosphate,3'-diphosphate pyrophosphatase
LRLGTVDVGSNTVHLMVVDVEPGIAAQTAAERRWESTVLAGLGERGRIGDSAQHDLVETLAEVGSLMAELWGRP